MNSLFYQPKRAAVGDVIPYFAEGEFKLFYLHNVRGERMPGNEPGWYLLGTKDFIQYQEYGPCKIHGGTGSVLEVEGVFHLFYCIFPEGRQIISHATGTDLLHWQTHPDEDFAPDPQYYSGADWRDPFVFWNADAGEYWMLIAARTKNTYARGGCVGLCVSKDLRHWEARPPLYAPNLYIGALECPDLFRLGDWWYLLFSSYTDRFATHYRMSQSPAGPWMAPSVDTFDGRAFYAAKTGTDGQQRYLFGWNPTRTENIFNWNPPGYTGQDFNTWDWGGSLVTHHIRQAADGTLSVSLPESIAGCFQKVTETQFRPRLGEWESAGGSYSVRAAGLAYAVMAPLPRCCMVETGFTYQPGTRRLGLVLRGSEDLAQGYEIQIEPDRGRILFKAGVFENEHGGKILPIEVELERPANLRPGETHMLKLVIEDSICEVYLNDQIAMSARLYDLKEGHLGLFVVDGEATFNHIAIKTT